MHPAYSVVFFTTASGAGYGLLALLGLFLAFGTLPDGFWFGFLAMGLSLGLIVAGLLSSTGHLGRPERAWRAFSQWRSSWLSREGVAAVLTFIPAGLLGIGWVLLGKSDGWVSAMGLVASLCAAATVSITAMIYASLKPVAQWHSAYTLPAYLTYAAMTGLTLLTALLSLFGSAAPILALCAAALSLAGWVLKEATWHHDDRVALPSTASSATGLKGGTVVSVEWPHTEENYLLKEMGFRVARKHADRLRLLVRLCAFALPAALLVIASLAGPMVMAIAVLAAAILQMAGMLVERWLFFAQARHTVVLYYGR